MKEWLRTKDLEAMFGCGHTKACEVMKSIKQVQDSSGGMRGIVAYEDYLAWKKKNKEKQTL